MQRAHRQILAAAIAAEVAIFAVIAPNFFTAVNFFEIARLNVELGLLAIALTPILITGGIDLSVGAMMGLAAVSFGAAWQDFHLPLAAAAVVAIVVGGPRGGPKSLHKPPRGSGFRRSSSRSAHSRCSAASRKA